MTTVADQPKAGAGVLRRLLGVLPTIALVGAALVAAFFVWPTSLGGCTTLTIVSGHSMEPTYYTGDLVVARCGDPEVGDVIVYQPADVGGARIIHRIIGGDAVTGWTMQGDNNTFVDPWTPATDEVLGVAGLHLAGVGRFAMLLISPVLWVSLVILAAGLLVWPGSDEDDDASDEDLSEDTLAEPAGPQARKRLSPLPLGLLLVAPLALQLGLPVAHAASLNLNAGSLFAFTQADCASAVSTVRVTITHTTDTSYFASASGLAAYSGKVFSITGRGPAGSAVTATGVVGDDGNFTNVPFDGKANGASGDFILLVGICAVPTTWT